MPDAAKPRKGSKHDASSTEDASQGTKVQTKDVLSPSTKEITPQEAGSHAHKQEADHSVPPPTPAQEVSQAEVSATEPSTPIAQERPTREQLERLRDRLKARYHS